MFEGKGAAAVNARVHDIEQSARVAAAERSRWGSRWRCQRDKGLGNSQPSPSECDMEALEEFKQTRDLQQASWSPMQVSCWKDPSSWGQGRRWGAQKASYRRWRKRWRRRIQGGSMERFCSKHETGFADTEYMCVAGKHHFKVFVLSNWKDGTATTWKGELWV